MSSFEEELPGLFNTGDWYVDILMTNITWWDQVAIQKHCLDKQLVKEK